MSTRPTATEPKTGDKVRCTLDDNVLVGKVMWPVSETYLNISYGNDQYVCIDRASWTVEVIEPEPSNIPSEPGLYDVTWENGVFGALNPRELSADGRIRCTREDGSQSNWHYPGTRHHRATWTPHTPPESPAAKVTAEVVTKPDPDRLVYVRVDPDDEQQVEALRGYLIDAFAFHPATATTGPLHDEVRRAHAALAKKVLKLVPEGRHQSLALTALQEAMMWCNAGIACGSSVGDEPQLNPHSGPSK